MTGAHLSILLYSDMCPSPSSFETRPPKSQPTWVDAPQDEDDGDRPPIARLHKAYSDLILRSVPVGPCRLERVSKDGGGP